MREIRNLADAVRRAAESDSDAIALIWQDQQVTWGQLDAQVDAVATALRALFDSDPAAAATASVGPSGTPPRVAIALPNVGEFATAYFGALRAGAVAVLVNPEYTGRELRHVLEDSAAVVLIATEKVLDALGADTPSTLPHTYTLGAATGSRRPFAELLSRAPEPVEPTTGGEELAALLYTSGTTGVPKGAMLSHRALIANHRQLAELDPPPVRRTDVALLVLPLFHSYGLNAGLGAVAYHGATAVLVERFDPAETLAVIERHRVTVAAGVPAMFVAWSLMGDALPRAFASVRLAVSGAAPLDAQTQRRFLDITHTPIYDGYGLTETAPVVTSTIGSPGPKPGSVGRPLTGIEVKLVDPAGDEVALDSVDFDDDAAGSPGTDPGEIVLRGPNLFSGYWPDGSGGPDADGWWATGDVAYADADGDLFLVDRLGELIIVNGFNVYPHEVETVLRAHPAVADAAVVGVVHPYTGQSVKAFVVRKSEAVVTVEDIVAHCEQQLARFKCPTSVQFVAELPRTAAGKVRKSELARTDA